MRPIRERENQAMPDVFNALPSRNASPPSRASSRASAASSSSSPTPMVSSDPQTFRVGMFTYNLEDERCGVPASVARKLVHKLGKVPSCEDFTDASPLPGLPPLPSFGFEHLRETTGLVPLRRNSDWLVLEDRMSSVGLWSRPSTSHVPMRRVASIITNSSSSI